MKDYVREFGDFARDYVAAGMPKKLIQAATFCCFQHDFDAGIPDYVQEYKDYLRTFSYHRYPTSHCDDKTVTAADLLAPHAVGDQLTELTPMIQAARSVDIPFWIGEGNSASCGGMPNVSDSFTGLPWRRGVESGRFWSN